MKRNFELWLVIELTRSDTTLWKRYYIEPSLHQFYRTTSLHERNHYQVKDIQAVRQGIHSLEQEGFVEMTHKQLGTIGETQKGFCIVRNKTNHFNADLAVVNRLGDNKLSRTIDRMHLEEMADVMFQCDQYDATNVRGNYRRDIGFSSQCTTDKDTIPGMNAPKYSTKNTSRMPGVGLHKSFLQSMMHAACLLKDLFEEVRSQNYSKCTDWNDFDMSPIRKQIFCMRQAVKYGLQYPEKFVTEGNTIGITGLMPCGKSAIIKPHFDTMNSREGNMSAYWGASVYVYSEATGGWIRISFGGYGKKCVCDTLKRYHIYSDIYGRIQKWKEEQPSSFQFDSDKLLLNAKGYNEHGLKELSPPQAHKELYYSIFVHGLLEIGRDTGYDLAILVEAVYAMTLTPSPGGWYTGIKHGLKNRRGGNLIDSFIEYMVREHKCVSRKIAGTRRQPSHPRYISRRQVYLSCRKMLVLSMTAQLFDPNIMMESWTGCVEGAGPLIAQEQVHVLTLMKLIKDSRHMMRSGFARNTETYERLSGMGLSSENMNELVDFLCARMCYPRWTVESVVCELFRYELGTQSRFAETVAKGQALFRWKENNLYMIKGGGDEELVTSKKWRLNMAEYGECVNWWDCPDDDLRWLGDDYFVLTRNPPKHKKQTTKGAECKNAVAKKKARRIAKH